METGNDSGNVRERLVDAVVRIDKAMADLAAAYSRFGIARGEATSAAYAVEGLKGSTAVLTALNLPRLHLDMAQQLASFGLLAFLEDPQIHTVQEQPLVRLDEFRDAWILRIDAVMMQGHR